MKTIYLNAASEPPFPNGTALTQGTFDGIHLGHMELLRSIIDAGRRLGVPSVLLTFSPHPAKVLRPSRRIPLLTLNKERVRILEEIGLDYLAFFEFTTNLAVLQADEYIRDILVGKLGVKYLCVGYNHTFGRKRVGNVALLDERKSEYGYEFDGKEPVLYAGEPVHSSRIRKDLIDGRYDAAVAMLNRPYRITGEVVKGRGVGRSFGFPTINIRAEQDKLIPKSGVYAAEVLVDGSWLPGMMYIAEDRSIFDLEVNLFDFEADLYGRVLDIDVIARTRDSKKFRSSHMLIEQIARDEVEIRGILKNK